MGIVPKNQVPSLRGCFKDLFNCLMQASLVVKPFLRKFAPETFSKPKYRGFLLVS